MSWFEEIRKDDVCVLERVHGPTKAKLVVLKRSHQVGDVYVVGWNGFTGFRAVADDLKVRWWVTARNPEHLDAVVAMMMAQGPKILKRNNPKEIRDSQRSKVYRWERTVVAPTFEDEAEMTLDECREFIRKIYAERNHRFRIPTIHDGRGHRNATYCSGRINLPKWARRRWVVLHELAHAIHPSDAIPAHGPLFMRTYIGLLHMQLGLSLNMLRSSAVDMRIEVAK